MTFEKQIAQFGRLRAYYHSYRSEFDGWHHVYKFTGGRFGDHSIDCRRCLHDDDGMFGRAKSHWNGYTTNAI